MTSRSAQRTMQRQVQRTRQMQRQVQRTRQQMRKQQRQMQRTRSARRSRRGGDVYTRTDCGVGKEWVWGMGCLQSTTPPGWIH